MGKGVYDVFASQNLASPSVYSLARLAVIHCMAVLPEAITRVTAVATTTQGYIYTFRSILLTTARRSFEGRMAPPNWQFRPSAYGLVLSRCLIVYLWHAGLYCSATCKVNTVQSATSFDNNTQGYYCCGILWVSVSLTVLCDVGC
jgi:hypothetical protein